MFGFGKKKVTQGEFEAELTRLLAAYRDWGGEDSNVPPPLMARLSEFKRIRPDRKASERLSRLLHEVIENQVMMMSCIDVESLEDPIRGLEKYRKGQTYQTRMNRAAVGLVGLMDALEESDPVRKLLIDYGVYDPSGGAPPSTITPASSEEKTLALRFLKTLQWCTSRQQLAMEEWNDALAGASGITGGDEIVSASLTTISEDSAPDLLPVATRRLTSARSIHEEFSRLNTDEVSEILASAIGAWGEAFAVHLSRCEVAVQNMRALAEESGPLPPDSEEISLQSRENELMTAAVVAQGKVLEKWGIDFAEVLEMMYEATNDLRLTLGLPELSKGEYDDLYSRGMAGQRPRFFA